MVKFFNSLFQDDEIGFAYISQREARPSLCESLAIWHALVSKYSNWDEADNKNSMICAGIH